MNPVFSLRVLKIMPVSCGQTSTLKAEVDENGREIIRIGSHRKGIVEELEKAHIYIEQLNIKIKAQNSMI